jgi:2-methylcitrate dehydratase PrpD
LTILETEHERNLGGEKMDAAVIFSKFIVNTSYEEIPKEVVEITKKAILDCFGVMIAGSTTDKAASEIVSMVREAGGKKESTIFGVGGKVPAWMAAFANGGMMHVLDYEDVHDTAIVHPTEYALPAALAIVEKVGGVSGEEFLSAIILAGDMAIRFGLARTKPIAWYAWLLPGVHMTFCATGAAGKLLKLNEDEMVSALGIAINQAAGSMEAIFGPGSAIRQIRDCFGQKAGVLSALMAKRGIKGVRDSFEGRGGLFNLYYRGEYNREALLKELGKKWHVLDLSFKAFPACIFTHNYIASTLSIVKEYDIKPEDVKKIVVSVGDRMLCEPAKERQRPTQSIDAKFSVPFTVAVAVVKRRIAIGDFLPEGLRDQKVINVAEKVDGVYDSELDVTEVSPAIVEIRTNGGKSYSKRVDYPYGHPRNPMSLEDLIEKFKDCVSYSAKPLAKDNINKAIDLLLNLEKVKDVRKIIQLLS